MSTYYRVLREAGESRERRAQATHPAAVLAQELLIGLEVRAAQIARPAPGSAELITIAANTGRSVTALTNNSGAAVGVYLSQHDLARYVTKIVGRHNPDPALMKPSPYRVRIAVMYLHAEPGECIFIGDTETDILAGLLGGGPVIGYANKPGKAETLAPGRGASSGHRPGRYNYGTSPRRPY